MAVAIGARPSIFFSSTDSKEITVVHTAVTDSKASKAERQYSFDCKRGLLSLASHPTDASTLFQFHDDSTVTAFSLRSSQRNPDLLWTMTLQPASSLATEVRVLPGLTAHHTCQKSDSSWESVTTLLNCGLQISEVSARATTRR